MEKVIIYGIANIELRRSVEFFLNKERFEIIGYSDTYYPFDWIDGCVFIQPEKIRETEYDFIIVANTNSFEIIKNTLIGVGVSEDKIVSTTLLLWHNPAKICEDLCHRVDGFNTLKEKRDAIVCGLSYSWRGIIYNDLDLTVYNFSASGLDMYYNLRLIEYFDPKTLNSCEYCFFVFPYYYFNYDMSRSPAQYSSGQIMQIAALDDWHNANMVKGSCEYINMFRLFGKNIMSYYNITKPAYINTIYNNQEGDGVLDKIWNVRYDETYKENEIVFKELMYMVRNMQLVLIVPPVLYTRLDEKSKVAFENTREQFYSIVNKYNINVWDYAKKYEACEMFDSLDHLNYSGAKVFTGDLNERIKELCGVGKKQCRESSI